MSVAEQITDKGNLKERMDQFHTRIQRATPVPIKRSKTNATPEKMVIARDTNRDFTKEEVQMGKNI